MTCSGHLNGLSKISIGHGCLLGMMWTASQSIVQHFHETQGKIVEGPEMPIFIQGRMGVEINGQAELWCG